MKTQQLKEAIAAKDQTIEMLCEALQEDMVDFANMAIDFQFGAERVVVDWLDVSEEALKRIEKTLAKVEKL